MKLADKFLFDHQSGKEGAIIHKRTFDVEPSIKEAAQLRAMYEDKEVPTVSESYLVGRIPMWLANEILKDAGVRWDDPAAKGVIVNALQSREYSKFRVWKGVV
jgi:hypothetical protein